MEEEKAPKKKNKSVLILIAAIIFIAAGAVLILTGNNKNLLGDDKEKETPNTEEDQKDDDTKRSAGKELSNEQALTILVEKYNESFSAETWSIQSVISVVSGDNNAYLVTYEEVTAEGTTATKQTIITINDGLSTAELPGWLEGERDVSSYNFGNQTAEPTETPSEPEQPVEEPTEPEQPVENQEAKASAEIPSSDADEPELLEE